MNLNRQERDLIKEFLLYDLEHEQLSNSYKKMIINIVEKLRNEEELD